MGRIETNGYYALGVPFYLGIIALEIALSRRKGQRVYGFADTIGSFSAGLGEIVIGLFLGPLLIGLYDFAYGRIALVRWPDGSLVPWILAFFVGDLCYYWYHRAGHSVAAFWAIHGVHHQTERFNVGVATRHPWFSDTYSFLFYAPVPMLGVPPLHFFVAISVISFYALTVHSQVFHRPGFWLLVTPATHIVHHSKNRRYANKNYGAMFTIWDRMFGTHVEVDPADPPILGTSFGYETHDGARAQWVFFRDLVATARKAATFGDKLRTFVRHPGWAPQGLAWPKHERARGDEVIPKSTKIYAAGAFAGTLVFALWVLWLRDKHPGWVLVLASLVILWGLSTIGGLLDGREGAARREALRLVFTAALGVAIVVTRSAS
jgi:alkylglycerol monooxygenase